MEDNQFKFHAEDWNLKLDDIQRATLMFTQDFGTNGKVPSKLLLFLYAKGILSTEISSVRISKFEELLAAKSTVHKKALERLTTIVEKGEMSPTRVNLDVDSMFEDFLIKHDEWNGAEAFVVFRDHQDLHGKSHALVERFQKSGLCYMHACVVIQHYLVAMNNEVEIPMLNMAEFLKVHMPADILYQHIWNNKGGDSLEFLKSILKETPESESIHHCSNRKDLESMDQCLRSYGPGLVSGFSVSKSFIGDDWQHLGKNQAKVFEGRHAMVLVGNRIVNGNQRFLLQNWWKSKAYIEIDVDYLISSNATVHFIKERQLEMGDFPTNYETLVECGSGIDASENFVPEGY